jgi:anti-sigma factor RsiW
MTMTCKQAVAVAAEYADGELDALRSYSIRRHLLGCAGCAARHHDILTLRARFREEVPFFVAPPALHARIRAVVGAVRAPVPPRTRSTRNPWGWLAGGVLAGCMASVFTWVLGTAVLAWRANEEFADAAVAAHVRATLSGHLIEVASSDRHTVKPWLSARLDYSPPVQDLATEGFTLVGGRLDFLERRPVATLVYRYGQHTIDVFVRPDTSRAVTKALRNVRGFNVAHANSPAMDWLAVSDAEPDVLSAFVKRLAREGSSQ